MEKKLRWRHEEDQDNRRGAFRDGETKKGGLRTKVTGRGIEARGVGGREQNRRDLTLEAERWKEGGGGGVVR